MRKIISIILLVVLAYGITSSLIDIPFGTPKTKVGSYYIDNGEKDTGAANIVTTVVLNYRGFDTLGEITVLFIAAIGLGAVLTTIEKKKRGDKPVKASLVLSTGCRFLLPFILLFSAYIFAHGHLTPGGGFQGGAIIASALLLFYLGCHSIRINEKESGILESQGRLVFVIAGLLGLFIGFCFLMHFLPGEIPEYLISIGIFPIIYADIAIGLKVGLELSFIIGNLIEGSE